MAVLKISFPVVLLDETLKFVARKFTDGKNPLSQLYIMVVVWAVYIGLAINSPLKLNPGSNPPLLLCLCLTINNLNINGS